MLSAPGYFRDLLRRKVNIFRISEIGEFSRFNMDQR